MGAVITILGREFAIECAERDQRRLEDLAVALNARLAGFSGDTDEVTRTVLAALSLMDEVQVIGAALVRARCEIERLSDMLVEARLEAPEALVNDERGRIDALRPGAP